MRCAKCRYQIEREVRIHISLQHAHIIKLLAVFEDPDLVYLVQVRAKESQQKMPRYGESCMRTVI